MSVTTLHPAYRAHAATWKALRDAYDGGSAVKAEGEYYLPRPSGMKQQKQYDAYLTRPEWFGATERAVHGMKGVVFRRPPAVTCPASLQRYLNDVTLTGVSLSLFAEHLFQEEFLFHRSGILLDYPAPTMLPDGTSLAPPPESLPYWILWATDEIINWRTEQRDGDTVVTLVVLRECLEVPRGVFPTADFFLLDIVTQYRVLRLDEQGQYEVSLWRSSGAATGYSAPDDVVLHARWVPTRHGVPLTFIPFVFEPLIEKSLCEALMRVNFRYFRHSADYEHGLH